MAMSSPFLRPPLSRPSLRPPLSRPSLLRPAHFRPVIVRPAFLRPLQNSLRFNPYRSLTYQPNTTAPFLPISPSPDPISLVSLPPIHLEDSFAHALFKNCFRLNKNVQVILFALAALFSWNLTGAMVDWVVEKYKHKYVKFCQLLGVVKNPLRVSLAVYLLLKVAFLLSTSVLGKYEKYLPKLKITILLLFIGKSLYSAMDLVLVWSFPSDKDKKMMRERTNIHTISSIVTFCGLFLATLETWGICGHTAFVTGGIMCAATSFALKDVFENVLKGLWLRFSEPYNIGDHIMLKSENLDGKVIDIRLTSITILDKKTGVHIVVPYTSLSQKSIFNASRATHVVVEEKFTIPFEHLDKVDSIIKSSNRMLKSEFSADDYCTLSGVGESGIELTVLCRVMKMDNDVGGVHVRAMRQSVLLSIVHIILLSGASIGKKDKKKKDGDDLG